MVTSLTVKMLSRFVADDILKFFVFSFTFQRKYDLTFQVKCQVLFTLKNKLLHSKSGNKETCYKKVSEKKLKK